METPSHKLCLSFPDALVRASGVEANLFPFGETLQTPETLALPDHLHKGSVTPHKFGHSYHTTNYFFTLQYFTRWLCDDIKKKSEKSHFYNYNVTKR